MKTSSSPRPKAAWAIILLLGVIIFSCKKDPIEVGLEVQPIEDRINVFFSDTTTLTAYSRINDSSRTDETSVSLLGSYIDPIFGRATAGFFTQFLLSNVKPDFGVNPVLDSMILSLAIDGYYGDTNSPMIIKVYELTEDLHYDSTYYGHSILAYDPVELSNLTYFPRPNDTVMVDSVKFPPHIRINLGQNPALANRILNGSESELADNESFVEFAKGLYITAEPANAGGSILHIRLSSSLTKIEMFFSNEENDSLSYLFRLDEGCARFNRFDHDYTYGSSTFQAQITGNDTSLGAQTLYLQSMQGINAFVQFPNLQSWVDDVGIAITRAELVLPVIPGRRPLEPPAQLLIGTYYENEITQLIDQGEGSSFIGGTYDAVRQEYRFRVTRHAQRVMNGTTENHPLLILVAGRSIQANRVLIGGPESATRTRLEITYVELPSIQ